MTSAASASGAGCRSARPRTHHRHRRVQSLAGAARGALHPSLHRHGVRVQRVLEAAARRARRRRRQAAARMLGRRRDVRRKGGGHAEGALATDCNWSQFDLGWMYTFFFVLLGVSAAIWGGWLERAGPRKAGLVSLLCWCGGSADLGAGCLLAPALDAVGRLRHHRRHRAWPRLHLARVDPHQVVPRPARHGDRHGHHGLRRRRDARLAAGDAADGPIQDARPIPACGRRSSPWRRSMRSSCSSARSAIGCRRRAGSRKAGRRRQAPTP